MINTQVMEMLTNPIVIVISQYLSIKSSFFYPLNLQNIICQLYFYIAGVNFNKNTN